MASASRSPDTDELICALSSREDTTGARSLESPQNAMDCSGISFAPCRRTRCTMSRTISTWVVAMMVAAGTASAGAADAPARKDLQVSRDVAASVQRYAQFTIFDDVSAEVKDGVVTLTGRVTMPFKRDDIARRVARVD